MRKALLVALCLFVALPTYAGLYRGIVDEEIVGDVVVQTVGPYRVVMAIDSAANGCDGKVDEVFFVSAETMLPRPVSLRFDHARVLIRADHVFVISGNAHAVVFTTGACDDCEFAPLTQVDRLDGFEVVRLYGERHWAPFKAQKKPVVGKNAVREQWDPAELRDIGSSRLPRVAPQESSYWYDPAEYWDPCTVDEWGNVPQICLGGGGGGAPTAPAKECQSGGNPSTSCSLTGCQVLGTTPGCSVSCPVGYYSCCYCDGGRSSCGCYKQ